MRSLSFHECWNSFIPLSFPTFCFLSLNFSDFVAGVPKGLRLYGLVRKLGLHFHLDAFKNSLVLLTWE